MTKSNLFVGAEKESVSIKNRITAGETSKGNQAKWLKSGIWYKADYLGYEGLAETMCSDLGAHIVGLDIVCYQAISFIELETKRSYIGCRTRDFVEDGEFYDYQYILERTHEKNNPFLTGESDLLSSIEKLSRATCALFGIETYANILSMLLFDLLVGNEDRHISNFGVLIKNSKPRFAPLFDHGLSILSDQKSSDKCDSIIDIVFKPFYMTYRDMVDQLKGHRLNIEFEKIFFSNCNVYNNDTVNSMKVTLLNSLAESEGKLWTRV